MRARGHRGLHIFEARSHSGLLIHPLYRVHETAAAAQIEDPQRSFEGADSTAVEWPANAIVLTAVDGSVGGSFRRRVLEHYDPLHGLDVPRQNVVSRYCVVNVLYITSVSS